MQTIPRWNSSHVCYANVSRIARGIRRQFSFAGSPIIQDWGVASSSLFLLARELRDLLLIFLAGLATLIAVDRIWFDGQNNFAQLKHSLELSSAKGR